MMNWSKLEDAYGPADEIPRLLDELTPDPDAEVWSELWGRICHQGTVYSSSFAALPAIAETATRWSPRQRLMALILCGNIISSRDGALSGEASREVWYPLLPKLRSATEESLRAGGWSHLDYIYLLTAWLSFIQEWFWSSCFESLANQEIDLTCPNCGRSLLIAIGNQGYFAAVEDYVTKPEALRKAIAPASPDRLQGTEHQILEWTHVGNQPLVEQALLHLCGNAACPVCDTTFNIVRRREAQEEA